MGIYPINLTLSQMQSFKVVTLLITGYIFITSIFLIAYSNKSNIFKLPLKKNVNIVWILSVN